MKDSDKDEIKMLGSNKKQFRVGMAYPVSIPGDNNGFWKYLHLPICSPNLQLKLKSAMPFANLAPINEQK